MQKDHKARIGIIGTGFIGGGLLKTIRLFPDLEAKSILTRRPLADFSHQEIYTNSLDELIDKSDLVVECNGDPVYVTPLINKILEAGIPVVTMDAEVHITSGTYLSKKGIFTEAEGDQPGTLAAMNRDLVTMGFSPLVYGNLKGFLNLYPTLEEMQYWSKVQGISLEQVTGFTDGTKINIEQALVANGLGAVIAKQGMYGLKTDDIEVGAAKLAEKAKAINQPISDYLLSDPAAKKKFPAGVFITAEYDYQQKAALKYLKLGGGPYYTMIRNYHLCHLEIPKTIRQVLETGSVLLNNSQHPTVSVAVISKKTLNPGDRIVRASRNFQIRGEAITIADVPNHLPIGLVDDIVVKQKIEPEQMIMFDDVELKDSLAKETWQHTLQAATKGR